MICSSQRNFAPNLHLNGIQHSQGGGTGWPGQLPQRLGDHPLSLRQRPHTHGKLHRQALWGQFQHRAGKHQQHCALQSVLE